MMRLRSFIAMALFFISISCYSGTLKITILSSTEKTKAVHFPNSRITNFNMIPILFHGLELNGISGGDRVHSSINRIVFDFDDDLTEITLNDAIQQRLLKWLKYGSESCINYSTNSYRLLAEKGKRFCEENRKETSLPNGFSFAFFLHAGISCFTGIGFKTESKLISLEDLKPGDLAVIISSTTNCVLQAMLYIGNETFMSMAQGVIYFQKIYHVKQLWDQENSSTLAIVENIVSAEFLDSSKNQSVIESMNGYMRPIDILTPPTGSYIK